jgi:hypothetical protein
MCICVCVCALCAIVKVLVATILSWCSVVDMARVALVSATFCGWAVSECAAWSAVDVLGFRAQDTDAFVRFFPVALRAARTVRASFSGVWEGC